MKKYLILFVLIMSGCGVRGMFNTIPIHVYDLNSYRGETGSIYCQVPLSIIKIDGMSIFEVSKKFNRKKDLYGMRQSTIYLIPGEHTLTVKGGSVSTSNQTITIRGTWKFRIHINANQKYKVDYKQLSKGLARVFIKSRGKEVGTISKKSLIKKTISLQDDPPPGW